MASANVLKQVPVLSLEKCMNLDASKIAAHFNKIGWLPVTQEVISRMHQRNMRILNEYVRNGCRKDEFIEIYPEMAEKFLKSGRNPRDFSCDTIEIYANLMRAGEWHLHSVIEFDFDGRLRNGFHRNWAIVYSGVPVLVRKAKVSPDHVASIDTMKPRFGRDLVIRRLESLGVEQPKSKGKWMASIIKNLHEGVSMNRSKIPVQHYEDLVFNEYWDVTKFMLLTFPRKTAQNRNYCQKAPFSTAIAAAWLRLVPYRRYVEEFAKAMYNISSVDLTKEQMELIQAAAQEFAVTKKNGGAGYRRAAYHSATKYILAFILNRSCPKISIRSRQDDPQFKKLLKEDMFSPKAVGRTTVYVHQLIRSAKKIQPVRKGKKC